MTAQEKRLRAALQDALTVLEWIVPKEQADFGEWPDDDPDKHIVERTRAALEASDASKRGKSNRSRGHSTERDVAAWLRGHGFPDAATTRSVLGSDGTRQPGDVSFAPGVVLSVKHVKTPAWPAWIRQVKDEAAQAGSYIPGTFAPRIPAVVHRRVGVADVGKWPTCVPVAYWSDLVLDGRCDQRIGDVGRLLDMFPSIPVIENRDLVVMRFAVFAETFRLDR